MKDWCVCGEPWSKLCLQLCCWCCWEECMESCSRVGTFSAMLGTQLLSSRTVILDLLQSVLPQGTCLPLSSDFTLTPMPGAWNFPCPPQSHLLSNGWTWLGKYGWRQSGWRWGQSPSCFLLRQDFFWGANFLEALMKTCIPKGKEHSSALDRAEFCPLLSVVVKTQWDNVIKALRRPDCTLLVLKTW